MDGIRREDTPPIAPRTLTLVRLKAGEQLTARILSPSLWGLWTHWNGAQSLPCFRDEKKCDGCKKGWPSRWKGFLHVLRVENRRQIFVELTSHAASMFLDQVPDRHALRGLRVLFERSRGGDNGRLRLTLLSTDSANLDLPAALDPLATLDNLWRIGKRVDSLGEVA